LEWLNTLVGLLKIENFALFSVISNVWIDLLRPLWREGYASHLTWQCLSVDLRLLDCFYSLLLVFCTQRWQMLVRKILKSVTESSFRVPLFSRPSSNIVSNRNITWPGIKITVILCTVKFLFSHYNSNSVCYVATCIRFNVINELLDLPDYKINFITENNKLNSHFICFIYYNLLLKFC
jgi:hypothetical protein